MTLGDPQVPGENDRSRDALGPEAKAVVALLDANGPFASYPGPVLLLDREKKVVAANPGAIGIVHALLTGTTHSVTAIVGALLETDPPRPQQIKLLDDETGTTTDLVALPCDDGQFVLLVGRDISLDQNLRHALVDSRQRFKDLIEISSDFAWETGPAGTFVFVSSGGALGYEPLDLVGHQADAFAVVPEGSNTVLPFTTREPMQGVEFQFRRADGVRAILISAATPLFDADGEWQGVRGVCRDVTEERRRDAALARARNRERLLAYIVNDIRDEIEPQSMLNSATRAIARAFSIDSCEILRRDTDGALRLGSRHGPAFGLPPIDWPSMDTEVPSDLPATDGRVLVIQSTYHREPNGAVVLWREGNAAIWTREESDLLVDVATQIGVALEQIVAHERLEYLSTTDPLTGLFNRRTFVDRLGAIVGDESRRKDPKRQTGDRSGALAYVDLDNFKQVNDQLGHQAGDEVLIEIAALLRESSTGGDLVARLGGDEFAFWLDGGDAAAAEERAKVLMVGMSRLEAYQTNPEKRLGLSVGVAVHERSSGEELEGLIARADQAMYRVKHGGKGTFAVADPADMASGDQD